MTKEDITNSYIYRFFSNRNLLQWPKSNILIPSDIYNELSLSYDTIIDTLLKVDDVYNRVDKEYKDTITDSMMDRFYIHIDDILSKNKDDNYTRISNLNKYKAYKKIYRMTIPNYIFNFIDLHKSLFPIELINLFNIIISNDINSISTLLNSYIKRTLLLKLLISNSKNKSSVIDYYNYSRFLYMYTLLTSYNLEPIIYNPNSGSMYFTISYSKIYKKEQIFDSIHILNNNNKVPIILDEVKLYVNTQIGEISQVKKLYDKKNKRSKIKYTIVDNIDHKVPNIIRYIIHDLITKYSSKTYKYSYNHLLGYILKNNIIVEDYCEKISLDGSILSVPLKKIKDDTNDKSFTNLESKEVRRLSINNLDLSLLLNKYNDILNPILRVISSSKV